MGALGHWLALGVVHPWAPPDPSPQEAGALGAMEPQYPDSECWEEDQEGLLLVQNLEEDLEVHLQDHIDLRTKPLHEVRDDKI